MNSLFEKRYEDVAKLKTAIKEQIAIRDNATLLIKTTAFAYLSEATSILKMVIPESFRVSNLFFVSEYLECINTGNVPSTEKVEAYKLVVDDLKELIGIDKDIFIVERGCNGIYRSVISFRIENDNSVTHKITFPNIHSSLFFTSDGSDFRASTSEWDYLKAVDSLDIVLEKFSDHCESKVTLTPSKASDIAIKNAFKEIR